MKTTLVGADLGNREWWRHPGRRIRCLSPLLATLATVILLKKVIPKWSKGPWAATLSSIAAATLAFFARGWAYDTRLFLLDNLICLFMHARGVYRGLPHPKDRSLPALQRIAKLRGEIRLFTDFVWKRALRGHSRWTIDTVRVGRADIDVHIMRPKECSEQLPLCIYYHGGGHCIGTATDAATLFPKMQLWKGGRKIMIAAVEYRLAPEHPYPAAADDATDALEWLAQHAEEIGADPQALSVFGISAGGNLAAVAAQHAARYGIALNAAVLVVPEVCINSTGWSFYESSRVDSLSVESMMFFWQGYCPDAVLAREPRASPVFEEPSNFAKLCPHVILTCSADCLRDAGIEYVRKCQDAKVDVYHFMARGSHLAFVCDHEVVSQAMSVWEFLASLWLLDMNQYVYTSPRDCPPGERVLVPHYRRALLFYALLQRSTGLWKRPLNVQKRMHTFA